MLFREARTKWLNSDRYEKPPVMADYHLTNSTEVFMGVTVQEDADKLWQHQKKLEVQNGLPKNPYL